MEHLYWTPHIVVHSRLQSGSFVRDQASAITIEEHFDWLLQGLSKFKPSNEASRKYIAEKLKIDVRGKALKYEEKHRLPATRLAKVLDLDEVQAMLILKRWLKDHDAEQQVDSISSDATALNDMLLQLLAYYNQERLTLLKCLQVVMLTAGEGDAVGEQLADLLDRLVKSNLEEQLHARLQENLDGGASLQRRIRASSADAVSAHGLGWLTRVHAALREQMVSERVELIICLLLLYELCGVACKPERAQSLAHLLLDKLFAGQGATLLLTGAGGSSDSGSELVVLEQDVAPGQAGSTAPLLLSHMLGSLLLLSCLNLPGHLHLCSLPGPAQSGAGSSGTEALLPLGGKTMDVHSQLRQVPVNGATSLLLITWVACLRAVERITIDSNAYRDLDGAARELEGRVAEAGGLAAAAAVVKALCASAGGALQLVYRRVACRALSMLCATFDLGADAVDPATYSVVLAYLRTCIQGNAQACADFWSPSCDASAPLRALLVAAAQAFPAAPRYLLQLLQASVASPETAGAAYAFLQRSVSLLVLHPVSETAIRHVGGGEVQLVAPLRWNMAPSVTGLTLPEGCCGQLVPLPAFLSDLKGRCALVSWEAEVRGGGEQSRGQVLLLGRACHCVASLEHSLVHLKPLDPSDPGLMSDLADVLGLMSKFTQQQPSLVEDLMQQRVSLGLGVDRGWLEVVGGVLALGPQLLTRGSAWPSGGAGAAPEPSGSELLQLLADAMSLLKAFSEAAPTRVLELLPQLPLLAVQDVLSGLPASVPLAALPAFNVGSGLQAFSGLMPDLSALQQALEAPAGRYPITLAFLELLAAFLERGFVQGIVPTAVLYVLHDLLPSHHQWRYASAAERWGLTHGALRVLRLAATVGSFATDRDLSTLSLSQAPSASPDNAAASGGDALPVTVDALLEASIPEVQLSPLSAVLLKLLLLNGGPLLAYSLPKGADALEALRVTDASAPEIPAIERCAAEALALLPPLLAAAAAHAQEQPIEAFLASTAGMQEAPPGAQLASYVDYVQLHEESTPAEQQLGYLALRALLAFASCAATRSRQAAGGLAVAGGALCLAAAVPPGGVAETRLRLCFRADQAAALPQHFGLAARLLECALAGHSKLVDGLMFPCALEEELFPQPPPEQPAADAAAAASTALVKRQAKPKQALDGLYAILQQASALKREHPQVLSAALRVVCAMWGHPAAAHRAVAVLRASAGLWPAIEACLAPVPADAAAEEAGGGDEAELAAHRRLVEALACRVLLLEVYARARSGGNGADQAGSAGASASGPTSVLDKLMRARGLQRLLRAAACPPCAPAAACALGGLVRCCSALYLEMGASVLGGLWGRPGEQDLLAPAQEFKEELQGVRALLEQRAASLEDIHDMHDQILQQEHMPGSAPASSAPPPLLARTHPLVQLLDRQCLGAALVRRCATLDGLEAAPAPERFGPSLLLSARRARQLLGPAAAPLVATDAVAASLSTVSSVASMSEAHLQALQAVCSLTALLLRDPAAAQQLAPVLDAPPLGADDGAGADGDGGDGQQQQQQADGGGSGLVATVQACSAQCTQALVAWAHSPDSRPAQLGWGLARLHAQAVGAALASSRLLLTAVQVARQQAALGANGSPPMLAGGETPGGNRTPLPLPKGMASATGGGGAAQQQQQAPPSPAGHVALCSRLAGQLAGWLRLVTAAGLPNCPPQVAAQVTDALAGATLLALQPLRLGGVGAAAGQGDKAAAAEQQLAAALLATIPMLCELGTSGGMSLPVAGQLLLEVTRLLPAPDWLPLLLDHLDINRLLYEGAARMQDPAACAGDLGLLQLAMAVAQVPAGAAALHERSTLAQLAALARHAMAAGGGGLATFSVLSVSGTGTYKPTPDGACPGAAPAHGAAGALAFAEGQVVPDTSGAYRDRAGGSGAPGVMAVGLPAGAAAAATAACEWAPAHKAWCTMLSFALVLLRTLGQHVDVELQALDFLMAAEVRLLLAVLPPGGGPLQPLTLAACLETERTLLLLTHYASRYLGAWHATMPSSVLHFRTAAATLVSWLAQPSLLKAFAVDCRPRTPHEAALAALPALGIPASEGWFRCCTAGSLEPAAPLELPRQMALATGSSMTPLPSMLLPAASGSLMSSSLGPAPSSGLTPAPPSAGGSGGAAGVPATPGATPVRTAAAGIPGLGLGTPAPAGAAAAGASGVICAGPGGTCSQYSARLAESLYACAHHALMFLAVSSPQLSPGEASVLGPSWPRPRDLSALLEQAMLAGEALWNHPDTSATHARRNAVVALLAGTGQLCAQFLDVMGPAQQRPSATELQARQWLASLELGTDAAGGAGGAAAAAAAATAPSPMPRGVGLF